MDTRTFGTDPLPVLPSDYTLPSTLRDLQNIHIRAEGQVVAPWWMFWEFLRSFFKQHGYDLYKTSTSPYFVSIPITTEPASTDSFNLYGDRSDFERDFAQVRFRRMLMDITHLWLCRDLAYLPLLIGSSSTRSPSLLLINPTERIGMSSLESSQGETKEPENSKYYNFCKPSPWNPTHVTPRYQFLNSSTTKTGSLWLCQLKMTVTISLSRQLTKY